MDYLDIDLNLTEEDVAVRKSAHDFAKNVMRPIAKELDEMAPEEVIADSSPLYTFIQKAYENDFHNIDFPESLGGLKLTLRQRQITDEEMGWGSFGLSITLGAAAFPFRVALWSGDQELIEEFVAPYCQCKDGSIRGCWAVNETDHGSDNLGVGEDFFLTVRANTRATPDGDHWIINGQKAAWVSGAATATHAIIWVELEPSIGLMGQGAAIIPLDLPGCSKGKPLHKMGMRELNQTELYFDEVRIPKRYMVIDSPEKMPVAGLQCLTTANMQMGLESTGLARAAFEEAFNYCKERVQGGRPLIEQYSMKQRLFKMFARVETARAISRRVADMNFRLFPGMLEYAMVSKTTVTELAYQNAHDAVQILGGNGLTREYLTDKLFRDARTTLIADGNNEVIERFGGELIKGSYPQGRNQMEALLQKG